MIPLHSRTVVASMLGLILIGIGPTRGSDPGLVGHWKLDGDTSDHSGNNNHGRNHGAESLTARRTARIPTAARRRASTTSTVGR